MYQNPTLFPQISNREAWLQIVEIADDDTGQPIALTDSLNNPLFSITLEITPARSQGHDCGGYGPSSFYDDCGTTPLITGTLANYISIVDVGTFQIMIPKSVMQTLRGSRTYDVFLTIDPNGADDGRQLLIGRLPVLYGGRNT
jgi:hypothetical protein